jgi:hypothetical protein
MPLITAIPGPGLSIAFSPVTAIHNFFLVVFFIFDIKRT